MRFVYICVLLLIGLLCTEAAFSARKPKERKKTDKKVYLVHADTLYFDQYRLDAQILVRKVAFTHANVRFFCDSAHVYESTNSFRAWGNVKMLQGDTLTLTCDYFYYDGEVQMAEARNHVRLKHRKSLLETDSLNYDRMSDVGYFFEGGRLTDAGNVLTSDRGEYTPGTREAVFNDNVKLNNPQMSLLTDTLHYNTLSKVALVLGPSNIRSKESHIYTERGFYNTQTEHVTLLDKSVVKNETSEITGDSIINNKAKGETYAFGSVVVNNKDNKTIMTGHYAHYNDSLGLATVTDSALVKDYSNIQDTLFLHADTFKLYSYNLKTDSVYRVMHAYKHARAYRSDLQAVSDSINFNSKDRLLALYKDPIVWQHNQQILGEIIYLHMNDSTIDSARVVRQALLVERIDSLHYNQIASAIMTSYFANGSLNRSVADGNVKVIFYQIDKDSLMIGMNSTETAQMKMYMKDKKLSKIWTPAATGYFYPPMLITEENRYLDNFVWFDYIRPRDKYDLFEWRAKKSGTELKESVRRNAPLQSLSNSPQKSK